MGCNGGMIVEVALMVIAVVFVEMVVVAMTMT